MNHIFNERKFKKLESPERIKTLPPDQVLSHLNIKQGDVIGDVGCGIGYFTFPFADVVGSNGKVIATDISDIMLEELTRRVKDREYKNISIIKSSVDDMCINENSVDILFTSTLIHELDDLQGFTTSAVKTLKTNGKLAYLDFEKKDTGFGPSVEKRISSEYVMDLFNNLRLVDVAKYEIASAFYLIIGKKK